MSCWVVSVNTTKHNTNFRTLFHLWAFLPESCWTILIRNGEEKKWFQATINNVQLRSANMEYNSCHLKRILVFQLRMTPYNYKGLQLLIWVAHVQQPTVSDSYVRQHHPDRPHAELQ